MRLEKEYDFLYEKYLISIQRNSELERDLEIQKKRVDEKDIVIQSLKAIKTLYKNRLDKYESMEENHV